MRKLFISGTLLVVLALPVGLSGQSLAIGARAGTLGLGGEVAFGLNERFVLRGGIGFLPYEYEGDFDDQPYTVSLPKSFASAGIDLYPFGGGFRLMGGVLFRTGNIEMDAEVTETREIGDTEYTSTGNLFGELLQNEISPFAGIGFGKHTSGGFGFFMDLGVAMVGEPDVQITASGPLASIPGIQADIDKEEAKVEEDIGTFLEYWPILSIGFKIPLGGGR